MTATNEAAERLREWAQLHAILRDYGSIPSDALTVLAALDHERSAGAAPIDAERLRETLAEIVGCLSTATPIPGDLTRALKTARALLPRLSEGSTDHE